MNRNPTTAGIRPFSRLQSVSLALAMLAGLCGCGKSGPAAGGGGSAKSETAAADSPAGAGSTLAFAAPKSHHPVDASTGWEPNSKNVKHAPDFDAQRAQVFKLEQDAVDAEVKEDFAAARKGREEVLAIEKKLYGADDWHAVRPTTMLAELDWMAKLPREQRNLYAQARAVGAAGLALRQQNKMMEATKKLESSLEMLRRLDAKGTFYVRVLLELGYEYEALAQFARADELLCEAVPLAQQLNGATSGDAVACLERLMRIKRRLGQYDDAYNIGRNVLDLYCNVSTDDLPDFAHCLNSLGLVCVDLKDEQQAEQLFLKAIELTETAPHQQPSSAGQRGMSLLALSEVYEASGDFTRAERPAEQAVEILMGVLGSGSDEFAAVEAILGRIYVKSGRLAQAEQLLKRCVAVSTAHGNEDFWSADDQQFLGELYLAKQDYAAAEPLLARAIKIKETALGPRHPSLAEPLKSYAKLLRATGRDAEAEAAEHRAAELVERLAAVRTRLERK